MENNKTGASSSEEASPTEQGEQGERNYAAYAKGEIGFDPTKELNLPGSYEEVTARFKRLQGNRAMEVLN
ncbi:MAG: hypothetical protein IPL52_03955 [Flavobacteriales bacterium]|nr:hypothetical protein [Flavobacteriales bacterium]